MPIDNEVYDRLGAGWWDEDNPLNMLHGSCTPGRMGFFREVLDRRGVVGGRALDVGCGAGFIAEELADAGFAVTGIDPSRVADRGGPCPREATRSRHRVPRRRR